MIKETNMSKTKNYQYGIEITKPWSSEMYSFNENLKEYYKDEILNCINSLETFEQCNIVASCIEGSTYSNDFSVEHIKNNLINTLECSESYWYNEMIEALESEGFIEMMRFEATPEMSNISEDEIGTKMNLIGFN